jgi:hypothetical protein
MKTITIDFLIKKVLIQQRVRPHAECGPEPLPLRDSVPRGDSPDNLDRNPREI